MPYINDYKGKRTIYKSTTCSDCDNWMKKTECPKESNGIVVSCGYPICDSFKIASHVVMQKG